MFNNVTILLGIVFLIVLTACIPDAPHDNPIDPYLSQSQSSLKLTGTVYTIYQPHQQLENVKVTLDSLGIFTYTDANGRFEIEGLQEKNYQLSLSKEGYQTDSLVIEINKQNLQQDFYLNALPRLSDIKYYSKKISTIFSAEPLIRAVIEVEVHDPDGPGDIDSVRVEIAAFSFKKNLQSLLPAGTFQLTLNQEEMAAHNMHELVEQPLWIHLKDKNGAHNSEGPFFIRRFIENTPQTDSPANQDIATQPIFFVWQETQLPYPFSYEINIFKRESGLSQLVFKDSGIISTATYYNYSSQLRNGIYYWTITIVDALNNSSESRETVFQIR